MTSQDSGIPSNRDFLWPTLQALKERGNSASKKEIEETITRQMDLSDEIMSATYETGAFIAAIRMGWARSWLKGMQLVGNAERGVWVLTPLGMRGLEGGERKLLDDFKAYKRQSLIAYKQEREKRKGKDKDIVEDENRLYEEDQRWKGALLKRLISLEPDAFERVCFAVLREYGYEIEKTGGAGDRGIDGKGILRLDNLISFDIAIQCKRYSEENLVRPNTVREFIGALTAQTFDRGLFITTSQFTKGAKEAAKESNLSLNLIGGEDLCELFQKSGLGLKKQTIVDETFFENYT